jgi:hypothetical protein
MISKEAEADVMRLFHPEKWCVGAIVTRRPWETPLVTSAPSDVTGLNKEVTAAPDLPPDRRSDRRKAVEDFKTPLRGGVG